MDEHAPAPGPGEVADPLRQAPAYFAASIGGKGIEVVVASREDAVLVRGVLFCGEQRTGGFELELDGSVAQLLTGGLPMNSLAIEAINGLLSRIAPVVTQYGQEVEAARAQHAHILEAHMLGGRAAARARAKAERDRGIISQATPTTCSAQWREANPDTAAAIDRECAEAFVAARDACLRQHALDPEALEDAGKIAGYSPYVFSPAGDEGA
jgi:hypothetical protein